MREMYCGYASLQILYFVRGDGERKKGSYNGCVVGWIPSFAG
jgi:hypothetical protein